MYCDLIRTTKCLEVIPGYLNIFDVLLTPNHYVLEAEATCRFPRLRL